ncbi:MAG: hypothetical protein KDD61_00130 [Bdellovibrionales bacterium]|nr:hypothetical protein [Bdellovibrionales bacterium]
MKRINTFLLICASFLMISFSAQAFMIEPYVGYEMGDYESHDASGFAYGARLGFDLIPMFSFGAEYYSTKSTIKYPGASTDVTLTDIGAFAMVEFPVLIRAWFTYIIDSKGSTSGSSDTKGTGTKIGVGYTGLPFVSLNFELINRKFTERGSTSISESGNTYLISLGLPLP